MYDTIKYHGGLIYICLNVWNVPEERKGNPIQYFCLENSMHRGVWQATVHGVAESDMTERISHTPTHKCTAPRVNPNVNCGLGGWWRVSVDPLFVVAQLVHCSTRKKCTTLTGDLLMEVGGGGGDYTCVRAGVYRKSLYLLNLAINLKLFLKIWAPWAIQQVPTSYLWKQNIEWKK